MRVPNKVPSVNPAAYVHPRATIVGDVRMESRSSVWAGASLRGDLQTITVGPASNVQDNCVIHTTDGGQPTILGSYVSLGHGAILHSARIEDECLIGMGSIILDDVVVGSGTLVAAGAVISPGTQIPPESLVMGVPGRVVKTDPTLRMRCRQNAEQYLQYLQWHKQGRFPPWSDQALGGRGQTL